MDPRALRHQHISAYVDQLMSASPPKYIEPVISPADRKKFASTSRNLAISHDIFLPDELFIRNVVAFPELSQKLKELADQALNHFDWGKLSNIPEFLTPLQRLQPTAIPADGTIAHHFGRNLIPPAAVIASLLINDNTTPVLLLWDDNNTRANQGNDIDELATHGTTFESLGLRRPHVQSFASLSPAVQELFRQVYRLNYTHPLLVYKFETPVFAGEEVLQAIATLCTTPYQWHKYSQEIEVAAAKQLSKQPRNGPLVGSGLDAAVPVFDFIEPNLVEVPEILPPKVLVPGNPGFRVDYNANERAHIILQHAWKQGLIRDATFVVINVGNKEIIGYRHRATGTFFLSDPITIHEPDYIRLMTGLFIASWRDFADRTSHLQRTLDLTVFRSEEERLMAQRIQRTYAIPPQIAPQLNPNQLVIEAFLESLPAPEYLAIVPSIQVKITAPQFSMKRPVAWGRYHTDASWDLIYHLALGDMYAQYRQLLASVPKEAWPTEKRQLSVTASVTWSTFGWSIDLKQERSALRSGLAAKIGTAPAQVHSLKEDYLNYLLLRQSGVPPASLPKYHLLLENHDVDVNRMRTAAAILVADNPGTCITSPTVQPLSAQHVERFKQVLDAIHDRHCLHGRIQEENLFIQHNGASVLIADFSKVRMAVGGAGPEYWQAERQKEVDALETVLSKYRN